MRGLLLERGTEAMASDQGVDGVVDVAVGFGGSVTAEAMVALDVVESFDVPGGGQLEGAVDLIETGDQVVIHGAGAACHEAVSDHAEVVADVTGTLGLALWSGGVVRTLHLGGVGELGVHGLCSTVDQGVSFAGQGLGGLQAGLGAVEAARGALDLGVAQKATLGVSS